VALRVVLVDDHPLVLAGLQQLLGAGAEFDVLAACGSVEDGLAAVETTKPDLLVLDMKLSDGDGLGVLRRLDPTAPPAVVVLTAIEDEDVWLDAVRMGARGVVLKATAPRVLEECLHSVHRGELWLNVGGVDLSQRLEHRRAAEAELERVLTPRELEIVRLVALRLDNQEIAGRLNITIGTVKIHLHHVYDKLGVQGRHDLLELLREKNY
jgi:DNA-binding NarL/FixJ family response regulator